ncbi:MAG: hypothetical protein O2818_05050 [Bacteroidetes bacterium]|nr:hypothetical protein [Bacteroidota bacterium]
MILISGLFAFPAQATLVGIELEEHATSEFGTTYRVYVNFDSSDDELVALYGTVGEAQNAPLSILTTSTFYNTPLGANYGQDINPAFIAVFPEINFDSWFTIGSEDNSGSGGVSAVGMEPYLADFNAGLGFTIDTFTGGSWFVIPGSSADAIAGPDNRVLVAQLTSDGQVTVVLNAQYDDANGNTSTSIGLTVSSPDATPGCTDTAACNYDGSASEDDGSCLYPGDQCSEATLCVTAGTYDTNCDCNALEISPDTDGDGICDAEEIPGCDDATACNYDDSATDNDGSCYYPGDSCDDGFAGTVNDVYQSDCSCQGEDFQTGPAGLEVEEYATSEYGTTYRVYATFDSPFNELIAVYGTVGEGTNAPLSVLTTTGFYNSEVGSNYGEFINPAFFAVFPELQYDSWFTIGTEDTNGDGGVSSVGMEPYYDGFNSGSGFTVDTFIGASWFVVPGSNEDAVAGDDNRVLVAQLTTDGVVTLVMNFQYDDAEANSYNTEGLTATFPQVPAGCMDATACNYDAAAEVSDGSCVFPGDSCDDGNAMTLNDTYSTDCGCVGEAVVEGCVSESACNFNAEANTDDGSCFYIGDACDDGDESTGGDVIGDDCNCAGVELVFGCMDSTACNYNAEAEASDDSCVYPGDACDDGFNNTVDDVYQSDCSCAGTFVPTGPAGLEVEEYATSAYGTTYRVYATFDSPMNELVAVYGTVGGEENAPLTMTTTTSFFNSTLGSNYGEFINPAFFSAFPEVEFDSWLTIGTESTEGSGGVNSVGMEPYYDGFNNGNGFTIDTFIGGSWFVVPGSSADAVAGDDNRVLVAQLTTDGVMTLVMNFQYDDEMGNSYNTVGLTVTFPEVATGCTDATACNYDAEAVANDGSCTYPGDACDDGDSMTMNDVYTGDCSCVGEAIVEGCTDSAACNYDPAANVDDGSCTSLDECGVCGGTGIPDGACDCEGNLPETYYDCDGICLNDGDGDGVCDELEIPGCLDDAACNYNADATDNDDSCTYPDELYNCDGTCVNDVNENGLCDELEVFGCTSETADNYDPEALTDNGTCEWLGGLVESLSYEVYAEDGIAGTTTYRLYANFASDNIEVTALYGTESAPWELSPTTNFYQDPMGTPLASGINPAFFAVVPTLEFDSWIAIGAAPGENDQSNTVGMDAFFPDFEDGNALNVNTFLGGSVFLIPGASTQAIPVDGKVLLAQVTTNGTVDALFNLQIRDENDESVEIEGLSLTFPQVEVTGAGCTDSDADNYDPEALLDDGTCTYPEPSYTGLTYELVAENEPEVGMRTFRVYANFSNPNDQLTAVFAQDGNPMSIETTSSFYQNAVGGAFASEINPFADLIDPDVVYDSWFTIGGENSNLSLSTVGVEVAATAFEAGGDFVIDNALGGSWFVLPDMEPLAFPDENGQVLVAQLTTSGQVSLTLNLQYRAQDGSNPQELNQSLVFPDLAFGCTDEEACNYDPEAEADDSSCEYPAQYYGCDGECNNDADGDGICDELEIPGCTDASADNYDADATDDDGSCEYLGCTIPTACNYDPSANTDDGSCVFPETYYDCDGNCLQDADGDGICDQLEVPGCTDEDAQNYDDDATDDDGSCEYPGCTNPNAENFDPSANVDDGSCIAGGCLYPNAANYDPLASFDDGSCSFEGCTDESASNYCPLALVDDESCVYDIYGCTYFEAPNFNPDATADDGSCEMPSGEDPCPFDVDGNGLVGSADLLEFLAAYSYPCPE